MWGRGKEMMSSPSASVVVVLSAETKGVEETIGDVPPVEYSYSEGMSERDVLRECEPFRTPLWSLSN